MPLQQIKKSLLFPRKLLNKQINNKFLIYYWYIYFWFIGVWWAQQFILWIPINYYRKWITDRKLFGCYIQKRSISRTITWHTWQVNSKLYRTNYALKMEEKVAWWWWCCCCHHHRNWCVRRRRSRCCCCCSHLAPDLHE